MPLLFSYGSLRRGETNHMHCLHDEERGHAVYVGNGRVVEKYPMVVDWKSGGAFLVNSPGKGKVRFTYISKQY